MMTPQEARKAWVEALRSGKYKQGREALAQGGRYCCLGVACELAIKDGVPLVRVADGTWVEYDGEDSTLPTSVQGWLGLASDHGGYIAGNHRECSLAARNDNGLSFAKIADIIESEPKGLFE